MNANPLSHMPLFAGLPESERDEILATLVPQTLQPGEILFREGDPGDMFYIVAAGEIEILLGEGKPDEMLLNIVEAGEYLGEMGLVMAGGIRTATARARGAVSLLCMSRARFVELTRNHPELSSVMVKALSQRLDAANTQSFRDLREKNQRLQAAYDELKAAQEQLLEKERIERELQVAADIQLSILPDQLPRAARAEFGARVTPARQVGGDFYDVFPLSEFQMGVVIGDVADKGIPSAIFMARAHALIMAEARADSSPAETLQATNRHIAQMQKAAQFVTALYGVIDLQTREFRYARAGHEAPLLLRSDGTVERLPRGTGMALGISEDVVLDERAVILPEDSTLLLYTDGMTDCRNPQGEPFGLERLKREFAALNGLGAQPICDALIQTLKTYQAGAKQDDDVTLLVVQTRSEARGGKLARQRREKM